MQTGKSDINDLTKIISYGGKTTPDMYMGESELEQCNGKRTSMNFLKKQGLNFWSESVNFVLDGGFNQQFLQPADKLHVFVSYLGR